MHPILTAAIPTVFAAQGALDAQQGLLDRLTAEAATAPDQDRYVAWIAEAAAALDAFRIAYRQALQGLADACRAEIEATPAPSIVAPPVVLV